MRRAVERFPFVPADPERLAQDCFEAYNIQVDGLVQRLRAINTDRVVIGVSGGLDSTHALIVAARAMDLLGLPRTNILAFTMPGFATGDATKANAWALMRALEVTAAELDIRPAARQMLADLDHPFARGEEVYDVTFENVQAGLRTDYLFRLANHHHGIVLGTGDLSELALGWSTYGVGDQMSHYNVNAGVPEDPDPASDPLGQRARRLLRPGRRHPAVHPGHRDLPGADPGQGGRGAAEHREVHRPLRAAGLQPVLHAAVRVPAVEDRLPGPACLAGRRRRASGRSASRRSAGAPTTCPPIRQWLVVFVKRFFGFSQFKRSAMPNGPKVSAGGSLSPRGDWRAPSDGNAAVWLAEIERNVPGGSA